MGVLITSTTLQVMWVNGHKQQNESSFRVLRGGVCGDFGDELPVACRRCDNPLNGYEGTGFRATLYIK